MVIVRRCPVCRGIEINLHMGGQMGTYRCESCHYIGPIILEEDIPDEEFSGVKKDV